MSRVAVVAEVFAEGKCNGTEVRAAECGAMVPEVCVGEGSTVVAEVDGGAGA